MLRKARMMVMGLIAALGMASASQAALVGTEVTLDYPNVHSTDIRTSYDASTGILEAIGTPVELNRVEGVTDDFFTGGNDGDFYLKVKINNDGTADFNSSENKVLVRGDFGDGNGIVDIFGSHKLLTFGYDDAQGAGLFYFSFKNQVNSPIANGSMTLGVILSAGNVTADFSKNFNSTNGKADTFVPVPTSAASGLVLLGVLGAMAARRKFATA